MRELNLTEMEQIEGGCSNFGTGSVALGGVAWAFSALLVTSTFGLGLFIVAGAAIALGAYDCS